MPLTEREREILTLLNSYLAELDGRRQTDPATVVAFGEADVAVQRWLQLAIQCCLDLGDSLLGKLKQPEPPRYRDIFAALQRLGVITADLAASMEALSDYRNALAHAYADLTPTQTLDWVRRSLPPMSEFARIMSLQA